MLILCLFKFMNMNNLQSGLLFSLTGITAVASLSSCASQKKTEEQKPYNIVYIMTDDHTAQMMSCYDKRYMETPNLDRNRPFRSCCNRPDTRPPLSENGT